MATASKDMMSTKQIAQAAIALSVICGIAGIFFDEGSDGATLFFSIAGIAVLAYGTLLAVTHIRAGRDLAGAGFLAVAIALTASAVAGYSGPGADAVFVSVSVLMLPGLLLIADQDWSPMWGRAAAAVSGLCFAIWGYTYLLGDSAPDTDNPLYAIAWLTFTVAEISWIMRLNQPD